MSGQQLSVWTVEEGDIREGGGAQTANNQDALSASPSKNKTRATNFGALSSKSVGIKRWCIGIISTASLVLILVAVGIVVKWVVEARSFSHVSNVDSATTNDNSFYGRIQGYNYGQCASKWSREASLADEGPDSEPLCADLSSEEVCSLTVHCCWIPTLNSCATYEGEKDCLLRPGRTECESSDYCLWRYDSQCRRGFPKTQEEFCVDGWNVEMAASTQKCSSYGTSSSCKEQMGCCWFPTASNRGSCRPYRGEKECSDITVRAECEESFSICLWQSGECLRGLGIVSSTLPPVGPPTSRGPYPPHPVRQTNIVILLVDDLGYGDVGYNGGISKTPNIDKLSQSASVLRLDNHHSMAVCSPSRCMLLSGQYPERNCVPGARMGDTFQSPDHMTTIAHDAKLAGYRTAFFGKWHLGKIDSNMIGRMGFDTWTASFGNLVAYDTTCFCDEIACKSIPSARCTSSSDNCYRMDKVCSSMATKNCTLGHMDRADFIINPPRNFECDMLELGKDGVIYKAHVPRGTIACEYLTLKFEEFLASVPVSVPVYVQMSFSEVHIPFVADPVRRREVEQSYNLPANSRLANYVSTMENVDGVVGRVKQLLLQYNRASDTLLIFTSDNGPEMKKIGGAGSPGRLRGWKRTIFEGGIRVPTLLDWPRRISSNMRVQQLTQHADWRVTFRELFKQENPAVTFPELNLDGESLLPLVQSPSTWKRTRDVLICFPQVDGSRRVCDTFSYFKDNFKIIAERGAELAYTRSMLFDLDDDVTESHNLAVKKSRLYQEMGAKGRVMVNDIMRSYTARCGR